MKKILLTLGIACLGLTVKSYAQTIMSQDFEAPTVAPALPSGWSQSSTGSTAWFTSSAAGSTWGSLTDAYNIPAHTQYVVVDDAADPTQLHDTLKSPVFDLTSYSNVYLSYDYFFYNATNNTSGLTEVAYVLGSSDGGSTWAVIDTLQGYGWDGVWVTQHVSLASLSGSNCRIAFTYSDAGGSLLGAAIDNALVYVPAANDLALTSIAPTTGSPTSYGVTGGSISMTGTVFNNGSNTVTTYKINYEFNGGAVVTNTISGVSIPAFTYANFTDPTAVTLPSTVGAYPIRMWITLLGDANQTNDSSATNMLNAVSFMPTKKLAIEEGTGTWCGWCVRGIVFMDSLRELYGNGVSLVAVHNSDPMTVTAYDAWMGTQISGYPSVVIDRTVVDDPQNLLSLYSEHHLDFGYADITTTPTLTGGTNLSVAVVVKPALDLSGDYRLVMALTEDKVHGTGSTWAQHNYYSYTTENLALTGQGVNYQDSLNPIAASSMYFDHVARAINPSVSGTSGVLPATMTAGSTYNATMTATLLSTWSAPKMHGIVMLLNNATGAVLNTQNFDIAPLTGVSNVAAGVENVIVFPNPASNEAFIRFDLKNNSKINVDIYDITGRVVLSIPSSDIAAGSDQISIPLSNFASGVYNVRIQTESGVTTTKLEVVK